MQRIHVGTSDEYDVIIGNGILDSCGEYIMEAAGGRRALIVSDSNVAPLYLDRIGRSLRKAGYKTFSFSVQAGEESKSFETLAELVNAAAESGLSRRDIIVALGGGMVGDLAGFGAAVYMRGITYVQIPTTVLAAVDSSVGGKTAVNISAGKNLAGAFKQPGLVICDCDCFDTLSRRERNSGYAEIIKYAMIANPAVLEMLDGPVEDLVAECVRIKADIVSRDEKDKGQRQLLNFGHTFGHALEQALQYKLLHGEAVARGMLMACDVAEKKGCLEPGVRETLIKALRRYDTLPLAGGADRETLAEYIKRDKKADGDQVDFIVPEAVGRCSVVRMRIKDIVGVI